MNAYDFSFQPPTARELVAVDAHGGIGYVSADPRKNWTRARIDEYHQLGLGTAVVHENTVDWRSWDGALANRLADDLGMPADRPIFYAVDRQVPTSEYGAISNALRAQPGRPKGIYGGKGLGHFCLRDRSAVVAWATNATSFDNGDHDQTGIAMQQLFNQSDVAGTDRNLILLDDWGQWPYKQPEEPVATKIGTLIRNKATGEIVYCQEGSSIATYCKPGIPQWYQLAGASGPTDVDPDGPIWQGLTILPAGHLQIPAAT